MNGIRIGRAAIVALVTVTLSFSQPRLADTTFEEISLLALLALPAHFNGRTVKVEGYFHCEHEDFAVYPTKEFAEAHLARSAVWVQPGSAAANGVQIEPGEASACKLHKHYISLEGRFKAGNAGHFGAFNGQFETVDRILRLD